MATAMITTTATPPRRTETHDCGGRTVASLRGPLLQQRERIALP